MPELLRTQATNADKLRALPWRLAGAGLNTAFCALTVFGSVFVLFMDELKLNRSRIGVLIAMMPLCGLLALVAARPLAHFGLRRSFLLFFAVRKAFVGALIATPWVSSYWGLEAAFVYTACCMAGFAVCRALSETAWYPWEQDTVPNHVRGKLAGLGSAVSTTCGLLVLALASFVINAFAGTARFQILLAFGTVFGFLSVWAYSRLPAEASLQPQGDRTSMTADMMRSLGDRDFSLFLLGLGFISFGMALFFPFAALYAKDVLGLSPGKVVLLEIGSTAGGFASAYFWGWASDRYGGKPVMLVGGHGVIVVAILWYFIPHHSAFSLAAVVANGFLIGVTGLAWAIGQSRLLFVAIIPLEKKTAYTAVFYAWVGLCGAAAPLLAGFALDHFAKLNYSFYIFSVNQFTPLIALTVVLIAVGLFIVSRVRSDGRLPAREFAGMFLQGNPILAIDSLVRYNFARSEAARVQMTERLGKAMSPLNVNELVDALSDISFNVRYEAIVTIARTRPHDRLTEALIEVLQGHEPDLAVPAAWALSRLNDKRAIPALREALQSPYPLLEAQAARALGNLGDFPSIPQLLHRFREETDPGLRLAYASSLGALEAHEALEEIFSFLHTLENQPSRRETAMAIARALGSEDYFIRLAREMRTDASTTASLAVMALSRRMRRVWRGQRQLITLASECTELFGAHDTGQAAHRLAQLLQAASAQQVPQIATLVLDQCRSALTEFADTRIEYIQLSLHTLHNVLAGDKIRPPVEPAAIPPARMDGPTGPAAVKS
jgi:MFS family permease